MVTTTLQTSVRSSYFFLCVSIFIHALLLCIPLATHIVPEDTVQENKLFPVELLIPEFKHSDQLKNVRSVPSNDMPKKRLTSNIKQKAIKPLEKKVSNEPQPREATVSLNRLSEDNLQYRSYLGHLRSKINSVWEYPIAARNTRLNGTVTVRFSIAKDGRLKAATITKQSPYQILDNEALRTIRAAAPFLPFPPEFSIEKLHVLASFEYKFDDH